jgi:hypothetical protein
MSVVEKLFGSKQDREIARLKRKARSLYYQKERIAEDYDCGHALLMVVSHRYSSAHTEFEAVMTRLSEIDPTAPRRPS